MAIGDSEKVGHKNYLKPTQIEVKVIVRSPKSIRLLSRPPEYIGRRMY